MHNKSLSIYIFAVIQKTVLWASCSIRLVDIYRKSHCSPTLKPSHKMSLSKINLNTCVSLWFLPCSKSYWVVHWGCWDHYNSGLYSSKFQGYSPSAFHLFPLFQVQFLPSPNFTLFFLPGDYWQCFRSLLHRASLSLSLSLMCCIGDGARGESTEREGNYGSLASERGGPQCQQIPWVTKPDLLSSEHAQTKHIQSNTHRESSNTAHQNTLHHESHVCDVVRAWKAEISYNRRNKTTPERDYQVQLDSRKEYMK